MTRRASCVVNVLTAVLVTILAGTSRADVIAAVSADQSSVYGSLPECNGSQLNNTSGLTATGDVSTWTFAATHGTYGDASEWYTNPNDVPPQWVLLNFDSPQNLSKIYLWNYTHNGDTAADKDYYQLRDTQGFRVFASDVAGDLIAQIGAGTLAKTSKDTGIALTQAFDLTGATSVQYVKIVIDSSYDVHNWINDVGLGKVRFETATPEPSAIVLLGIGLIGLLAYAWRKRK
jgi:hypothetical protein